VIKTVQPSEGEFADAPANGQESTVEAPDASAEAEAPAEKASPAAALIEPLERLLGYRIIVYYARNPTLGNWDVRPLDGLLRTMGKQAVAGIVIQSRGGDADVAHHLSNLIREYVDQLHVYVPTYASSAATLFALSADKLWMGPSSELSPIDPQIPVDPKMLIPMAESTDLPWATDVPISVPAHVIRDFLELIGVLEQPANGRPKPPRPRVDIGRLESLLKPLNPWILGWYERADKVSRVYANEALVHHLLRGQQDAPALADRIVETLLDHYASHEASITRKEARRIGIPVEDCPADVWAALEKLMDFYERVPINIGRVIETTDGFHVIPQHPQGNCRLCSEAFEADPSFRFCPHCGNPLDEQCRSCSGPLSQGWKFCPRCAAPIIDATPQQSKPVSVSSEIGQQPPGHFTGHR
jgi:hypothetical protein